MASVLLLLVFLALQSLLSEEAEVAAVEEEEEEEAMFSDWRKLLTKLSKVLLPVRKVTWWPCGARAGPKKLLMADVESARFRHCWFFESLPEEDVAPVSAEESAAGHLVPSRDVDPPDLRAAKTASEPPVLFLRFRLEAFLAAMISSSKRDRVFCALPV